MYTTTERYDTALAQAGEQCSNPSPSERARAMCDSATLTLHEVTMEQLNGLLAATNLSLEMSVVRNYLKFYVDEKAICFPDATDELNEILESDRYTLLHSNNVGGVLSDHVRHMKVGHLDINIQ